MFNYFFIKLFIITIRPAHQLQDEEPSLPLHFLHSPEVRKKSLGKNRSKYFINS
jgi:hypothetical protein